MGELAVTVRLRQVAGFKAAREMVLTDYGKSLMDQIRAISIQMGGLIVQKKAQEKKVLVRREEKIFLAGGVLAATIVSFWAILYRLIGNEIRAREDLMRRLREESTHDFLTGLFNRPAALEILVHAIGNAQRNKWMVGILMVDLDGFKGINDRWGHLEGDRVLVEVARRFQGVMREGEVLARLGGDEFLCLMPVLEDSGGVFLLAKRSWRSLGNLSGEVAGTVGSDAASVSRFILRMVRMQRSFWLRRTDACMSRRGEAARTSAANEPSSVS